MENTALAEVIRFPEARTRALDMPRIRADDEIKRVQGVSRDIFVAELRRLADQVESGELDGCNTSWRRGDVLLDESDVPHVRSELKTVTISADTDWRVGTVRFVTTHIEEV